ncbi:MAG: hypothetical protein J5523_02695 [Muribaculaceae bacterium]|nr:hypothetical protein [Muribaculaceae bacterium]
MKKKLFYLAALLCCVATGLAFTSCGDDEPDVTATARYSIIFDDDFFNAVDLVIIYYKDNGEVKADAITSGTTSWVKDVSGTLPNEFGVKWQFQPKDASSLTEESYNLFTAATISLTASNGSTFSQTKPIISNASVKKNDVIKTIQKASGNTFGYRVSKNGDAQRNDNLNYDK